jgi:type III restriction enzyme
VRLHENIKVELETYGRENSRPIVKPIMLVIARNTAHAATLIRLIQSGAFFEGRFADKVIQVDSSVKEDETVARLLRIEKPDEPTEIVIHVNMLKEGWDINNLYTIVPLRAAHARTLIVQSIGRGLRLPYGERTRNAALDRLYIVAHDRFQEIVDEANRPGSAVRVQQLVLTDEQLRQKLTAVVAPPLLEIKLRLAAEDPIYNRAEGLQEQQIAYPAEAQDIIRRLYDIVHGNGPGRAAVSSLSQLQKPDLQAALFREVMREHALRVANASIAERIVGDAIDTIIRYSVDIPRIVVEPISGRKFGDAPFTLDLSEMRYEPPTETLWATHLRTGESERIRARPANHGDEGLEDLVVTALVEFDDVAYDQCADLLYDLAAQVVRHLSRDVEPEDVRRILRLHHPEIARSVHAQMQNRVRNDAPGRNFNIIGLSALKPITYTVDSKEAPFDFRSPPWDKSAIARHLYCGFSRCLYRFQKFHSDPERVLALILDRETSKWFKPAKGQLQLFYRSETGDREYQPDFVAETEDQIYMIEAKARNQMKDPDVLAKRDAGLAWCGRASNHAKSCGGKPWTYLLIPHDVIAENVTIKGLAERW